MLGQLANHYTIRGTPKNVLWKYNALSDQKQQYCEKRLDWKALEKIGKKNNFRGYFKKLLDEFFQAAVVSLLLYGFTTWKPT